MTYEPPKTTAGLPPTKLHVFTHNYTNLANGASLTLGSRPGPGYASSYYLGTTGSAPPVASDFEWRFRTDGEATASHSLIAIGDSVSNPGAPRSQRNQGEYWTQDASSNSWSYVNYEEPLPYTDGVSVELHNPSGATSPEGWALATVADRLNIPPMKRWKRHAVGDEDQTIAAGETLTLATTTGRGRFYGYWMDTDNHVNYDQTMRVYIDGETTPSIELNTGFVSNIWRGYDMAGSDEFGVGEDTSGAAQLTHYYTPGHMGLYSDFEESMTVTFTNNDTNAGAMDWSVIWDEAI